VRKQVVRLTRVAEALHTQVTLSQRADPFVIVAGANHRVIFNSTAALPAALIAKVTHSARWLSASVCGLR
jgi:hypothetical protein